MNSRRLMCSLCVRDYTPPHLTGTALCMTANLVADDRDGSWAAVQPRRAEGPQQFQYPTTCCVAANYS
jgi:hypothetical protein